MPSENAYRFYDTTVALNVPEDIASIWNLLYGNFATEHASAAFILTVRPEEAGRATVSYRDETRVVPQSAIMVHLQDIVQNRILTSVRSHILFHGALWRVNGRGVLILAESNVGKSTLSLACRMAGGEVLTDEVAGLDVGSGRLHPFPRAIALRTDSAGLCGLEAPLPRVMLDEEKLLVSIKAFAPDGIELGSLVLLHGPADNNAGEGALFELSVSASSDDWITALKDAIPGAAIGPHPDMEGWWRCRTDEPVKSRVLSSILDRQGAVLTGYHRGAFRRPDYGASPVVTELAPGRAAEVALSHIVNGRGLAEDVGSIQIMGQVRAMLSGVHCLSCVPGRLDETLAAVTAAVTPRN